MENRNLCIIFVAQTTIVIHFQITTTMETTTKTIFTVTPEEVQENKQIAATILSQLGGNKFAAMTGAKNFSFSEVNGSLKFNLPATNIIRANCVQIALNGNDTYTVTFFKINVNAKSVDGIVKELKVFTGIYFDMLADVFESTTGLRTSL